MHLQSYTPAHTTESLQTIFEEKYQLEDFEDRYFRYMDYDNVVEFSREEYAEFMDILAKGNVIFVKAYEFYRKDLTKPSLFCFYGTSFCEEISTRRILSRSL